MHVPTPVFYRSVGLKKTRVCDLLNINYPILQGGMLWLADAELAAAVSNAGAFGILSPNAGIEKGIGSSEHLENLIEKLRHLTCMPFGVNIPLDLKASGIHIDTCLRKNVKTVITAAGNPAFYTGLLKKQGMTVLHVVSSVRQAKIAESSGVDALIVEGYEAAAHKGFDEICLFPLLPQVCDTVSIPVIAAGGIADSRTMFAAFALGAEGAQMGTRFVTVKENIAHDNYKHAVLAARDRDTVITGRYLQPTRSLRTPFSAKLLELESTRASEKDIRNLYKINRARLGQIKGNIENGEFYAGSSSGLIREIIPVSDLILEMVDGYNKVKDQLAKISGY